jgi:hypothetical protein
MANTRAEEVNTQAVSPVSILGGAASAGAASVAGASEGDMASWARAGKIANPIMPITNNPHKAFLNLFKPNMICSFRVSKPLLT